MAHNSAFDYLLPKISQQLTPMQTVIAVTTTAGDILQDIQGSRTRGAYVLQNLSADAVSLGFGKDAIAGQGIVLQQYGSAQDSIALASCIFQGRISAISAGTSNLAVFEQVC